MFLEITFIDYIICSKTLPLQLAIGADDSMATTRLRAIGLAIAAMSRKSEMKNSNSIYFLIPCHQISIQYHNSFELNLPDERASLLLFIFSYWVTSISNTN